MFCTYQKRPAKVLALKLLNQSACKEELYKALDAKKYSHRETINGISFANNDGFSFAQWGDYVVEEAGCLVVYTSVDFSKTYEEPMALWLYVD